MYIILLTCCRVYQNSLLSGQRFALEKRRLMVFYIEENTRNPSTEASEYRNALADPILGDYINDNVWQSASFRIVNIDT